MRDAAAATRDGRPASTRRARVVIAGGGIAGLAAARALRLRGVDDFVLLEMEDTAGGNSRGGSVQGIACPQGAHYLPVPGDAAHEVQGLLEELGVRRRESGRWVYDEMTLCHSPQERLFINGAWQEGLVPMPDASTSTLAQYRRFEQAVAAAQKAAGFTIPVSRAPLVAFHRELDATAFAAWLGANGFDSPELLWYLDYCCRDDYGGGSKAISAWAGLHYFAARHGFKAPGSDSDAAGDMADAVLTWPEGNGWLSRRLAEPLGDRSKFGMTVRRIEESRHGVEVLAWDEAKHEPVRWQADACIVALPVFIAVRVVESPPGFLARAAAALSYAPWLVANLHLSEPLADRGGAAPSWDNVIHGDPGLGYVDARHQTLDPRPGPTVLSYYLAMGDAAGGRARLQDEPWSAWRDEVLAAISVAHCDLRDKTTRIDITRYGHAMSMPRPGLLAALHPGAGWSTTTTGRLHFAHADWSGYSIFEEAFTRGHLAGEAAAG